MLALLLFGWLGSGGALSHDAHQQAEALARDGRSREALARFERIAAERPHDVEVRLWIARLLHRLGEPRRAEAEFRRALEAAPRHVEALSGLAGLLAGRGAMEEAMALLERAESLAPDDAGVLATRGQCLRFAGRTIDAERLYARAAALSPNDPDIRAGWEQVRRLNRHRVELSFQHEAHEGDRPAADIVDAIADARRSDALRVHGRIQVQRRFAREEARAGGGLEWRAAPRLTIRGAALFGPGADLVARTDLQAEAEHARGRAEGVAALRRVSFAGARVWIVAPALTWWHNDRTAIALRYFGSATAFESGTSAFDHSGAVRLRRGVTPRLWFDVSYARGYESFDTLSTDRLGSLRADTWGGGVLYHLRGVQSLSGGLEYQLHSDGRRVVRATVGAVHRF